MNRPACGTRSVATTSPHRGNINPNVKLYFYIQRFWDRKALIITLEQHRREISELQQSRDDLLKQIIEYIDDLGEINQGDLSKRLDVYACFIGTFGEAINLLVKDLSEAVQSLPATHPLHKKYLLQKDDGNVPPEKLI